MLFRSSITFEAVKDSHQESHDKSSNSWAWTRMQSKGQVDETLRQSQLTAKGQMLVNAVDGLHIDVKDINQQSVSLTIDAMVQADPSLAWLKDAEVRGDVDWRQVKELHDSWDVSHSGLGGPAMIVIIIIVTYFTAGAASGFVGSAAGATAGSTTALSAGVAATATTNAIAAGWANIALSAALTSAAGAATVSTINNKGNLGAAVKETFSSDSMKNYIIAGITAGLAAGLYNGWTSTTTGSGTALTDSTSGALANTGKVIVANPSGLGSLSGIGQFAANQALQNTTSAVLNKALGRDGSLSDALQNSLVNAFAAYGFNLVGDIGVDNKLQESGLAKIGLHAVMGGLASLAAGQDFKTGALAAGVNEALVDHLASAYAGMSTEDKARLLTMNAQLIGVLTTAVADPNADTAKLQVGSWVAQNGTQYNYLSHNQEEEKNQQLKKCGEDKVCAMGTSTKWALVDIQQDIGLGVGVGGGIGLSAAETAEGMWELAKNLPETMAALKQLATSEEFRQQFGDNYFKDLETRATLLTQAYNDAGWDGAVTAGVEGGRFAAELVGVLTAVRGAAAVVAKLPTAAQGLVSAIAEMPVGGSKAAQIGAVGDLGGAKGTSTAPAWDNAVSKADGDFGYLPPLRQNYVREVYDLQTSVDNLRAGGASAEDIAKYAYSARNDLKLKYREYTPPDMLETIDARNMERYGNKIGPAFDDLVKKGKTFEQIIESSTRAGGGDIF